MYYRQNSQAKCVRYPATTWAWLLGVSDFISPYLTSIPALGAKSRNFDCNRNCPRNWSLQLTCSLFCITSGTGGKSTLQPCWRERTPFVFDYRSFSMMYQWKATDAIVTRSVFVVRKVSTFHLARRDNVTIGSATFDALDTKLFEQVISKNKAGRNHGPEIQRATSLIRYSRKGPW